MTTRLFAFVFAASAVCMPVPARAQRALDDLNTAIASVAERVLPSVVEIETNGFGPVPSRDRTGPVVLQSGTGSGVIVSADGFVVTNAHVVAGAAQVFVQLGASDAPAGRSVVRARGRRLPARIVGLDRETDVALLKIEATGLRPLELADSEALRQGQVVLAFGSPFGLDSSVSLGIVSSIARQISPDDRMIYVQTDALITPGNSGGPLVDVAGRVVGINTLIAAPSGGSTGLGFAVPSNIVKSVVAQLREHGAFVRSDIGVAARTITPELVAGLGLQRTNGVVLEDVIPRGPAAAAGLRVGDIVLSLDGKPMENARQFAVNLYALPAGTIVQLRVLRGDTESQFFVPVWSQSGDSRSVARLADLQPRLIARLGILAVAIDDRVGELQPAPRLPNGILVTNVVLAAGGASQGAFQPGDIIHTINGRAPQTIDGLEQALAAVERGATVVLQIERAGRLSFVATPLF